MNTPANQAHSAREFPATETPSGSLSLYSTSQNLESQRTVSIYNYRLATLNLAEQIQHLCGQSALRIVSSVQLNEHFYPQVTLAQTHASVFVRFMEYFLRKLSEGQHDLSSTHIREELASSFVSRFKVSTHEMWRAEEAGLGKLTRPFLLGRAIGALVHNDLIEQVRAHGANYREYIPSLRGLHMYASLLKGFDFDRAHYAEVVQTRRENEALYLEALRTLGAEYLQVLQLQSRVLENGDTWRVMANCIRANFVDSLPPEFFRNAKPEEIATLMRYSALSAMNLASGGDGRVRNGFHSFSRSRSISEGKHLSVWETHGLTEVTPSGSSGDRSSRPTLSSMILVTVWARALAGTLRCSLESRTSSPVCVPDFEI